MPPPIQRTMTESAVALGLEAAASALKSCRAGPAARALRVAAEVVRKERRLRSESSMVHRARGRVHFHLNGTRSLRKQLQPAERNGRLWKGFGDYVSDVISRSRELRPCLLYTSDAAD